MLPGGGAQRLGSWAGICVPHTVVVENAGCHLMERGLVEVVFVGTDRTRCAGDVCNKIGTYLMALAAKDFGVPFYVALPGRTIELDNWRRLDGDPHRGATGNRGDAYLRRRRRRAGGRGARDA